jgi:hypothetical protein
LLNHVGSTDRQIIIGIIPKQYDSRNLKSAMDLIAQAIGVIPAPIKKGRSMTGLLALNIQLS